MTAHILHGDATQVILASTLADASVFAYIGNNLTFEVANNKGDPDVWMNVRKLSNIL